LDDPSVTRGVQIADGIANALGAALQEVRLTDEDVHGPFKKSENDDDGQEIKEDNRNGFLHVNRA